MKYFYGTRKGFLVFILLTALSSCGRESSPEGRMEMKLEGLQKVMIDSLMQQNRLILDSLGKISSQLNELKQLKK